MTKEEKAEVKNQDDCSAKCFDCDIFWMGDGDICEYDYCKDCQYIDLIFDMPEQEENDDKRRESGIAT